MPLQLACNLQTVLRNGERWRQKCFSSFTNSMLPSWSLGLCWKGPRLLYGTSNPTKGDTVQEGAEFSFLSPLHRVFFPLLWSLLFLTSEPLLQRFYSFWKAFCIGAKYRQLNWRVKIPFHPPSASPPFLNYFPLCWKSVTGSCWQKQGCKEGKVHRGSRESAKQNWTAESRAQG